MPERNFPSPGSNLYIPHWAIPGDGWGEGRVEVEKRNAHFSWREGDQETIPVPKIKRFGCGVVEIHKDRTQTQCQPNIKLWRTGNVESRTRFLSPTGIIAKTGGHEYIAQDINYTQKKFQPQLNTLAEAAFSVKLRGIKASCGGRRATPRVLVSLMQNISAVKAAKRPSKDSYCQAEQWPQSLCLPKGQRPWSAKGFGRPLGISPEILAFAKAFGHHIILMPGSETELKPARGRACDHGFAVMRVLICWGS
ncbi:hypothetical protein B0H16DRAFT_1473478 [Mycena metata]|uniref:Uncharacterized protein n=1 Tax=Mycena metata TaxID=1033252 RepID=A0AAD7ML47_9AGAR|nr:hypothetical protein B0H16DRAFT_1473478 [Mycena metata]